MNKALRLGFGLDTFRDYLQAESLGCRRISFTIEPASESIPSTNVLSILI